MVIERDGKRYLSETFGVNLPTCILAEIEKYGSLDQVIGEGEYLLNIDGGIYNLEIYALLDGNAVIIEGISDFNRVMHRQKASIVSINEIVDEVIRVYEKSQEEQS